MITQEQAQAVLTRYHGAIVEAVHAAFDEWTAIDAPRFPLFRKRTQANQIQDAIDTRIRTLLGGDQDVAFSKPKSDRFWVTIKQPVKVLVRFKKLTEGFTTRNVRTRASNWFDRQRALEGIPVAPRITIGYRLDRNSTRLLGVWVVFLKGDRLLWKYELVREANGAVSIAPEPTFALTGLQLKPTARKKKVK